MKRTTLFLLAALVSPLYAQQALPADPDAVFIIVDFQFEIQGHTRPDALLRTAELRAGETLLGHASFLTYIEDKKQILINQRVLKDTVQITYRVEAPRADGAYPVILRIAVEEPWNTIMLPLPEYSSNTGFGLSLKFRNYNFLGTMSPLALDLAYQYDENQQNIFSFELVSNTPFTVQGLPWNFRFDTLFTYRPAAEASSLFQFRNTTGLALNLPVRATTLTFGIDKSFHVNEQDLTRPWEEHGYFQDGFYLSNTVFTTWKIPTGVQVSRFGELTYTPELSATFNHRFEESPLLKERTGPFLDFGHTLGFEKINWYNNYRQGFAVSLNNSYRYDINRARDNEDALSFTVSASAVSHIIINRFSGVSSRLQYRAWFSPDFRQYKLAGDAVRGIADKALLADQMLALNLDFPFRLPMFAPSQWFGNRNFRFFDVEFLLAPVIDVALYRTPGTPFKLADSLVAGAGAELVVFPAIVRNLYMRLSIAWNIGKPLPPPPPDINGKPADYNREITVVMGHLF